MTDAPTKNRVRANRVGCLAVLGLVLVIVVIIVVAVALGGGGSSVTGTVKTVGPLDGNTVRIYIDWENSGSSPTSASCIINTVVHNQFGDVVTTETNSTSTNGNVAGHGHQLLYQDIGVTSGDAGRVTKADVTLSNCA